MERDRIVSDEEGFLLATLTLMHILDELIQCAACLGEGPRPVTLTPSLERVTELLNFVSPRDIIATYLCETNYSSSLQKSVLSTSASLLHPRSEDQQNDNNELSHCFVQAVPHRIGGVEPCFAQELYDAYHTFGWICLTDFTLAEDKVEIFAMVYEYSAAGQWVI